MNFTASAAEFRTATEEYRDIWANEGRRIVAAMERVAGLRFEPGPIPVNVYEGTSYSGERGGRPMFMRASYPLETKRGTRSTSSPIAWRPMCRSRAIIMN